MHFLVLLYIFLYHYWLFTRTLMYPDGCFCEVTHKIHLLIFCFLIGSFISKYFFTTEIFFVQVHDERHGQLVQDSGAAARGPEEADGDSAEGHCQHEETEDDAIRVHDRFQEKLAGSFG